ncbi:MAG: PEP-CTERM sorting domain-containing protein [Burkholderiaceae bacterium]
MREPHAPAVGFIDRRDPALTDADANAVPEPETYAMLLTGLGVMGWVVRRRKRS